MPGTDVRIPQNPLSSRSRILFAAFSDLHLTIHDQIAEGDKVATRKTMSGTHQGAFAGMPATGKRMTLEILEILHIDGGKILGYWVFYEGSFRTGNRDQEGEHVKQPSDRDRLKHHDDAHQPPGG